MMKYVRHKTYGVFLFPDNGNFGMSHKKMAEKLGLDEVVSAGFVRFDEGEPICHGRAGSLGMGPLDDDTSTLSKQLLIL